MSIVEREYYKYRLQVNEQNLKASWRLLKDILNKTKIICHAHGFISMIRCVMKKTKKNA